MNYYTLIAPKLYFKRHLCITIAYTFAVDANMFFFSTNVFLILCNNSFVTDTYGSFCTLYGHSSQHLPNGGVRIHDVVEIHYLADYRSVYNGEGGLSRRQYNHGTHKQFDFRFIF